MAKSCPAKCWPTKSQQAKTRLDSNLGFIQIQYHFEATRNSINEIDPVECKPTKKHYPNPPSLSVSLSIVNLVIAEEKLFLRKRSGAKRKKKPPANERLLSIIVQGKDPCLPVLLPLLCTVTQLTKQDRRNQGTFASPPPSDSGRSVNPFPTEGRQIILLNITTCPPFPSGFSDLPPALEDATCLAGLFHQIPVSWFRRDSPNSVPKITTKGAI